jgi:hypothetical protein
VCLQYGVGYVIKFTTFGVLWTILAFYSAGSSAIDCSCSPHSTLTYGFEDLIIPTRVYGETDRRGELSKLAASLKLTKAQSNQIRGAVGVLNCKANGTYAGTSETAFLIGSNKEITTASHGLVDKWGGQADLRTCYFENFEIPPKRVELLPQSPRNIISKQPSANDRRDDRARLELKSALVGVIPLTPDFSGKKLAKGTPTILVAAQHHDFKGSGIDPILSPCSVQDYFDHGDGLSRMTTDCDADKGSSGGVYLTLEDGKIYAKALQVGGGADYQQVPNHSPYNNETNYEGALVIDQSFLDWYSK